MTLAPLYFSWSDQLNYSNVKLALNFNGKKKKKFRTCK